MSGHSSRSTTTATMYSHPFTLSQAIELESTLITQEMTRLKHSIQHLERSNQELVEYLQQEGPEDEFELSIKENEVTMHVPRRIEPSSSKANRAHRAGWGVKSLEKAGGVGEVTASADEGFLLSFFSWVCSATQRERIEILSQALKEQIGVNGSSGHYELPTSSKSHDPRSETTVASGEESSSTTDPSRGVVDAGTGPGDDEEGMYL
ncbi:BQ2448_6107 [Microbotryum intermedium]|uniref:BQ2448_6107 protein n=1 Tax=Microbotryum intermedium TaxID=269621 RepID=A0A238FK96_9BASI|nr:BQ2448_6107 [Microbotryum intermedium]